MKAILTALIAIIFNFQCFSQDSINKKAFLTGVNPLIQFYNYERALQRNEEIVALYMASDNGNENKDLILKAIEKDKDLEKQISADNTPIRYVTFKNQTIKLVNLAIFCFNKLYNYGAESKEFKNGNDEYQPVLNENLDTLNKLFNEENFIIIDSITYNKIKVSQCNTGFSHKYIVDSLLNILHPVSAYMILKNNEKNSTDEELIYMSNILLKLKYADSVRAKIQNADSLGLTYLTKIIDKNAYSPYLFEAWIKWRTVEQSYNFGISVTSDIPNDVYDSIRNKLINLIVDHIKKAPSDTWAYLQFFDFQYTEIIHRFGPYRYGNQSAIDRNELFYKN